MVTIPTRFGLEKTVEFPSIWDLYNSEHSPIKDDRWHLEFDEEAEQFEGNEINEMITNVCIS